MKIQLTFVKIKKDLHNGKLKDKIIPLVKQSKGTKEVNEYKQLELYVGYDFDRDPNIDYCEDLVLDGQTSENKNKEKIQIFNSHGPESLKYNTTNIPLVDGKMLCKICLKMKLKMVI